MTFMDWFQQYNKAFVGIFMVAVYLLNLNYGIELPIDEDIAVAILGALISGITWRIPNKPKVK